MYTGLSGKMVISLGVMQPGLQKILKLCLTIYLRVFGEPVKSVDFETMTYFIRVCIFMQLCYGTKSLHSGI